MSTIYIREQGQLVPLDIPEYRGDRGEAGQTPDLQVGSATALPNEQQASVTIQGDKENPTINFGIPSGMTRDKGLYVGRPEDAYDETKVVFDDENWIDDTYFENSTVDYMGGEHESLKGKSDADVEYILRKFGSQHYEGSNITATDTYSKQVKSAILKGRTLVNLSEINKFSLSGSGSIVITAKSNKFKINTVYTRVVFITKNTLTGSNGGNVAQPHKGDTETVFTANPSDGIPENFTGLLQKRKFTTPSTPLTNHHQMSAIRVYSVNTGGVLEGYEVILEGDYTNQDIPYFEGMASVKMPAVRVVGKNLFSDSFEIGSITSIGTFPFEKNRVRTVNYIKVEPSTTYKIKDFSGLLTRYCVQYDKYKKVISEDGASNREVRTVVTKANTEYIRFTLVKANNNDFTEEELQLIKCMMVKSETDLTEYEPYKHHTLTIPSDLELRGIGNVQDTLDLVTGEKVERIGEIVLDGSEDWIADNVNLSTRKNFSAYIRIADKKYADGSGPNYNYIDNLTMNDRLPNGAYNLLTGSQGDNEGASGKIENRYLVSISKSKLETQDLKGFKSWLSKNPITVQYELKTPNIESPIDLNNQKIYSYDGVTRYATSSLDGHPNPILSIDVPTNITSLIKHQQNTINQQILILSEREEMQNILIDSTLSRYEQTLLTATHISEEEVPNYIQKLYEVAYKRGIRIKEGEL